LTGNLTWISAMHEVKFRLVNPGLAAPHNRATQGLTTVLLGL